MLFRRVEKMPSPELTVLGEPKTVRFFEQLKYYRKLCIRDRKSYVFYLPKEIVNGFYSSNKKMAVQLAQVDGIGTVIILNPNDSKEFE